MVVLSSSRRIFVGVSPNVNEKTSTKRWKNNWRSTRDTTCHAAPPPPAPLPDLSAKTDPIPPPNHARSICTSWYVRAPIRDLYWAGGEILRYPMAPTVAYLAHPTRRAIGWAAAQMGRPGTRAPNRCCGCGGGRHAAPLR